MSSYSIEMMEDGTAMAILLEENFDFVKEGESHFREIAAMLDEQTEPICYIVDLHKMNFSYDETILITNRAARGDNPVLHHKNIKEIIYVIGDVMQNMVAKGMDSEPFGNLKSKVVYSLEDALEYVRANRDARA